MIVILRNTGLVCLVCAALTLLMGGISFLLDGSEIAVVFGKTVAVFLVIGVALFLVCRKKRGISIEIAAATALLGWMVFSIAVALPFWWAAGAGFLPASFRDFSNCLFEGTSAATSTGLTVVEDTAALPASFQFWRSISQWVGGIGVLVLAISFVEWGKGSALIYRAAARSKTIEDDIRRTTRSVLKVHLSLTLVIFILFGVFGMPWWEALNHSLTTTGTGGFTMNGGGAGEYDRPLQCIMIFGMICGAISFVSHYRAIFQRRISAWSDTPEHRLFYALLITGIGLAWVMEAGIPVFDRIFLWVSALTTTGFSTVEPTSTNSSFVALLIVGMFVGAMAGSTAGGIKTARLLELGKQLQLWLSGKQMGQSEAESGQDLQEDGERTVSARRLARALFLLWLLTAATGACALLFLSDREEFGVIDYLFEVLSAMGCAGLSSGLTFNGMETSGKILLCALMWLGRIELLSFFVTAILSSEKENCAAFGVSASHDEMA